jgi:hypothetical protein
MYSAPQFMVGRPFRAAVIGGAKAPPYPSWY